MKDWSTDQMFQIITVDCEWAIIFSKRRLNIFLFNTDIIQSMAAIRYLNIVQPRYCLQNLNMFVNVISLKLLKKQFLVLNTLQ